MFIVVDDSTGAFVNSDDVTHVTPQDDDQPGSYVYLRDEEMIVSPLTPKELLSRTVAPA